MRVCVMTCKQVCIYNPTAICLFQDLSTVAVSTACNAPALVITSSMPGFSRTFSRTFVMLKAAHLPLSSPDHDWTTQIGYWLDTVAYCRSATCCELPGGRASSMTIAVRTRPGSMAIRRRRRTSDAVATAKHFSPNKTCTAPQQTALP